MSESLKRGGVSLRPRNVPVKLQEYWEEALEQRDDTLVIFDQKKSFKWFIENHEGQYLGCTGAGPNTLRFTVYDKE